jgi:uncharacterized membrane protein YeaQ/YmgE (transglycosylase-associated protein family)
MVIARRIRHGMQRFWEIVDSEGVGIFQAIVYVHIVLGGLYGSFIAGGTPQAVEDSMGHTFSTVWLWLCMGAVVCLYGKSIMKTRPSVGIWLQLAGDIYVLGALGAYVLATLDTSWWGKAVWAVFIVAAIAECVVLLTVRDVRRIIQIERILRL